MTCGVARGGFGGVVGECVSGRILVGSERVSRMKVSTVDNTKSLGVHSSNVESVLTEA